MNEELNLRGNSSEKKKIITLIRMKDGKQIEVEDYKLYNSEKEECKDYKNFNIKDYEYLVPGQFIGEGENEWVTTGETIKVSDIDNFLEK